MPIYEYFCDNCGEAFEKVIRFSESEQSPACPKCESQETHKKISKVASFGTVFLGSTNTTSSSCASRGGFS